MWVALWPGQEISSVRIYRNVRLIHTLGELWARYLPWAKEHKKTWDDDMFNYQKHLEPRFGKKRLDAIAPIDIERMKLELKKGLNKNGKPYAAATIKHQLVLLNRLFNLAKNGAFMEATILSMRQKCRS